MTDPRPSGDQTTAAQMPRLPVYLDGELLEALAQTLDPSGVPGTRREQFTTMGRTLEGRGYAVKAGGKFGARLMGIGAAGEASGERSKKAEDEAGDAHLEEQEFIVREATLLWQAHSILADEGHLKVVDGDSIDDLEAGDWVEMRVRSTSRSLLSFAQLAARFLRLQAEQADQRLERLREGEALLRSAKGGQGGVKIGEMTVHEAREIFMTDLVTSLAAGSDAGELQTMAAMEGFAEEVRTAEISDISADFLDARLADWNAVLTVRTANHERLAGGALRDADFGVFGKVSLVRKDGDPIRLVRRTMLDWMEDEDLKSLSSEMEASIGGSALTIEPPLVQVLPLALWV